MPEAPRRRGAGPRCGEGKLLEAPGAAWPGRPSCRSLAHIRGARLSLRLLIVELVRLGGTFNLRAARAGHWRVPGGCTGWVRECSRRVGAAAATCWADQDRASAREDEWQL
eukprot:scaffold3577_cov414-Prasinococcus_capsulatus_cf.AAC.13